MVSQLEIYSRSFIAHKLHSQEIMDQFLPLLYFHPLRKQKRRNNGIRVCTEDRPPSSPRRPNESPRNHGDSTPKFRSVIAEESRASKRGLRVTQREGAKYEKYLSVLGRRDWVKYLTWDAMVVMELGWARVERSEIRASSLESQIIEVTFSCSCSEGAEALRFSIEEEPSIELRTKRRQLSPLAFELEVKGLWIKFGYALPTITFTVREETVTLPLPFSFNNYLAITPAAKPALRPPAPAPRHRLDRREFPYIQSVRKFLRGTKIEGGRLSGWVRFFSWECNLRISLDAESFLVEVEPTHEKEDDILLHFLPLFLVRLLAAPAQPPPPQNTP